MNDRGRTCRGNSGGLAKRNTYWHIFWIKYLHNLPCTFVIRLDDLEPAESRLVGSVHLPAPLSITSTTTTTTTTATPTTTTEAAAGSFVVSYTSEAGVSADEDEELERILTDSTELPQEFLVGSVSLEELAEAGAHRCRQRMLTPPTALSPPARRCSAEESASRKGKPDNEWHLYNPPIPSLLSKWPKSLIFHKNQTYHKGRALVFTTRRVTGYWRVLSQLSIHHHRNN